MRLPYPILFPDKMLSSYLLARMKQGNGLSGQGVYSRHPRSFEFVTHAAGKTQVGENRFTPLALWNNVVGHHALTGDSLLGLTIGTAVIIRRFQLMPQITRKIKAHRNLTSMRPRGG